MLPGFQPYIPIDGERGKATRHRRTKLTVAPSHFGVYLAGPGLGAVGAAGAGVLWIIKLAAVDGWRAGVVQRTLF